MINNVTLVGRLTKSPEVKVLGQGTAVCNFTLAVNRPYKNADTGENEADFIQCQAWKGQAEFIGAYLEKGSLIGITGAINTRTYDKDGVTKYITEVNVNQVQSLEKKKESSVPMSKEAIQREWKREWERRSIGLDSTAQTNLRKELVQKYQPQIDALGSDMPF